VKFLKTAAADNMGDALVSQLGVTKASSNGVKTFAEMMARENALVGEAIAKIRAPDRCGVGVG
jgi:hypothetical protein